MQESTEYNPEQERLIYPRGSRDTIGRNDVVTEARRRRGN